MGTNSTPIKSKQRQHDYQSWHWSCTFFQLLPAVFVSARKQTMDSFMSEDGVNKSWCSCQNMIWTQIGVYGLIVWNVILTLIVIFGFCCRSNSMKQAWPYLVALLRLIWRTMRVGGRTVVRCVRRSRTKEGQQYNRMIWRLISKLWLSFCDLHCLSNVIHNISRAKSETIH